jgi:CubicO group peptidase (beta-lactamase class C family)
MKRYISFLALSLFFFQMPACFVVFAQTDPIDDYIQIELKKRQIPGLALVVIRGGEVIKMKGYGFGNLEHDVPVTPDTVFELASVTYSMARRIPPAEPQINLAKRPAR